MTMPAEWADHTRTWMSWPTRNSTFTTDEELARARVAWGRVATTIAKHEPVTLVVDPADVSTIPHDIGHAVERIMPLELNDAWMRDSGATFVRRDGVLAVANWEFNGWGAQDWAAWDKDSQLAGKIAREQGLEAFEPGIVNEGGGFHVDGAGTVLLTETVQLDPGRNPGATHADIEQAFHAALGTSHAIWLPRGLTRDYDEFGTRGHVDIVAAFAPGDTVLVHSQQDPQHPDHAVSQDVIKRLSEARTAAGNPLTVVEVPAPKQGYDADGEPNDWSYINHLVCNDAVVLCAFDDENDEVARDILQKAYPDRTIELVDARDIFAFGGGVHCITQQQPTPN